MVHEGAMGASAPSTAPTPENEKRARTYGMLITGVIVAATIGVVVDLVTT
ncbi:MAG TPA: hypothetical protein VKR55_17515 [Bradyrhizobium sp.]|nr:hypothetical protein [Bradyrhizobium sp.]HLZ03928.1 hypothetical protein [Bradyrhizobium sp.]